jgi:general stress protein 26
MSAGKGRFMARISRHWIALAAVLILEPLLSAQPAAPAAPSREAILAAAKSIIKTARYATLTTLDESGGPAARIVDPFPPEQELTIWVATNSRTRKAAQLARDGRVTLTYFDRAAEHYVTIAGTATLVRDLAARAARWKDEWKAFYENTYRGDDYLLIRIEPQRVEVVAPSLGFNNDPNTWRPVTLEFAAVRR